MERHKIKEMRAKLNISQESFAHKIGVTWGTVNRWENDKAKPSLMASERLRLLLKEMNMGGI